MKKFILKFILITLITFVPIISCNYFVDPANIFHDDVVRKIIAGLSSGNIVEVSAANMDEGLLQEMMIQSMDDAPETVIIGSSHVMYIPFEYGNLHNAGMSGSWLGDYYSIVGLLKDSNKLPKRIIIGVDPWVLLRDATDGRWVTLNKYAVSLKKDIFSNDNNNELRGCDILPNVAKLKKLSSIEYFQSVLKKIRNDGFNIERGEVGIALDSNINSKFKIVPDGRRIPAKNFFKDSPDIEKDIDIKIEQRSIYSVGKGFTEIPNKNLEEFDKLLYYLISNDIEVHLYLPAWHPRVYELFSNDENYSGVLKVEEAVRKLSSKYGISVHGGYNPTSRGFKTEDFMDWMHLLPDKSLVDYQSTQN